MIDYGFLSGPATRAVHPSLIETSCHTPTCRAHSPRLCITMKINQKPLLPRQAPLAAVDCPLSARLGGFMHSSANLHTHARPARRV
jgi:hypothetical protein